MKEIQKVGVCSDGGTTIWIEPSVLKSIKSVEEANNTPMYYLDKRHGSCTIGELLDKYPGEEGVKVLNKEDFIFLKNEKL